MAGSGGEDKSLRKNKRPQPQGRLSSKPLTSVNGLDGVCHLYIDHSRWLRDWYYRLLIRRCVVAELLRVWHISFDFVCSEYCPADDDRLATLSRFEYEVWLDLPAGTPPLQVSA
jgi:hypothetical protein